MSLANSECVVKGKKPICMCYVTVCKVNRSGIGTRGGLARNHQWKFLRGSAFTAEALGILWALKLAWEWGMRNIMVESDCQEVVDAIQDQDLVVVNWDVAVLNEIRSDTTPVLHKIRCSFERDWDAAAILCDRETNMAADALANEARTFSSELVILNSPPNLLVGSGRPF
ncbi:uncharacterized protein LOC129286250 [Prosopis cineraria]|uniref:uncharacterized protein LOC129286250 n=1 Tax=Prosopis cineraria TaxID=364024 RepID=UPI00240F10D8|nr:uncharacterized protein LOC129286250 [Prosopis cineraria]